LIAPLVLAWSPRILPRLKRRGGLREFGFITLGTMTINLLLFSGLLPNGSWSLPMTFLPIVCVGWAATVGRTWPALVQAVIFTLFVIFAHSRSLGPCVYLDPSVRSFAMWAYLITLGVIAIGLSGLLSERDEAERQLKASEDQYRAIIHDNPALICQFRTDGVLLVVNETFRRTFQDPSRGTWATRLDLRKKDEKSRNFFVMSGLTENPAALNLIRSHNEPTKPIYFETRTINPDEDERWFRWTARAVDMSSSAITAYHAVGLDVTDQKRVEAEREQLEAQAIQTQQYEAIGVFAGGIAHEFNNILTSVIGYVDYCQNELPQQHAIQPMMKQILLGAQRAADLTKQLSIYGGQSHTYPRTINLATLIEESNSLVQVAVPKRYEVRYDLAAGVVEAYADESKLRRLLLNLITNAAEALANRPRTLIHVRTCSVEVTENSEHHNWTNGAQLSPGAYAQITVQDTGCGMDREVLARIFQPFFTTKFPGRGLGLPAVLGIVQDHRGAIQVESRPQHGTTIRVILPSSLLSLDDDTLSPVPLGRRRSEAAPQSVLVRG
jgi:two-component system, cell cycle sensor histidine kinase and response regulator CckA